MNPPRRKARWIVHGLNRGSLHAALTVACRVLPRGLLYQIADHLAAPLVHACVPALRRALAANLGPVDPRAAPLRVLRVYARNLLDTVFASLPGPRGGGWSFEDDRAGDERFRRALGAGRGVIVVSPHLGNWDIGCRSLAQRGFSFHVVAQPEADPLVEKFRRRTRHEGGDVTIGAGSAMESFFRVRAELERGRMVLMLADRALPGDAVAVTFFGRRAAFPRAAAAMAHLTGAPVVPAAFVRCGDGLFRGLSSEPLFPAQGAGAGAGEAIAAIATMTQRIASAFEGFVREYPEQWFNFYSFWETKAD